MSDRLREYHAKRDFGKTAEPAGGALSGSGSGRLFVVQKHAARQLHYDLRLEYDGVLLSWAVPRGPSLDPRQKPLAVRTEDHPIEYASFEGIIPEGSYGAGAVMVWDEGEWEPIGDPVAGLAKGDLKFRLHGQKLRGAWVLAQMSGKGNEDGKNWLLIKKRDDAARPIESFNVLGEMPRSVLSERTLDEIEAAPEAVWTDGGRQVVGEKKKNGAGRGKGGGRGTKGRGVELPGGGKPIRVVPAKLKPQLATLAQDAPDGDQWLHEIKLDGYRLLCRIEGGVPRLLTRNGHDWTDRFASVAAAAGRLPVDDAVLDGEVVVLDARGVSDFQALQNAFRGYGPGRFAYFLFDVPFAAGHDLRSVPLVERKAYLQALLQAAPLAAPALQYCDHIEGRGPIVFEKAAASGLEGIVSKRADASYEMRRTHTWLKIKCALREEFVVGGITPPSGGRTGFGAMLIGQHDDRGELVYCGRVGTGFNEHMLGVLEQELRGRVSDEPPFVDAGRDPDFGAVRWVRPELVAQVEFTEWTKEGLVRQASFLGLRADIDPADVVSEASRADRSAAKTKRVGRTVERPVHVVSAPASPADAIVGGIRISHPDRTVYPDDGVTKIAVARYYEAVADRALQHMAGRPLSLVRCPLGLAGEAFYQRKLGEGFPDPLRGITIGEGTKQEDAAILIDDLRGLLALVQMGVLEIHAWGCRADDIEKPDRLVFDLDPGPGLTWPDIVAAALVVRDELADIGLTTFVKTTGGKGVHLVAPITRRSTWEEAKTFTLYAARRIAAKAPRNFVTTMSRTERTQRIFIDYLRNQRGSTAVAAWSTRARNGATVSTPLAWEELESTAPGDLTVTTVPGRDDPWEGFFELRQSITVKMQRAVGL